MIRDSPLIGTGIGTFTYQYAGHRPPEYFARPQATNLTDHAHNELLEITAEQGLLGLAMTLWLLVAVLVHGWRGWNERAADRWLALGASGGLVVLLVHNQFDINLRLPPNQTVLWLLMGLVVRAARRPVAVETQPPPTTPKITVEGPSSFLTPAQARAVRVAVCVVLIGLIAHFHVVRVMAANLAFRRALVARDRGDWETAMENYLRCLEHDPYRVEAWYRLAFICAQFRQTDEQAIEYYLQVAELAPDYGDVNTNLAFLFVKRNRHREAVPYLQRAVELNPYNVNLRKALAQCYQTLNLDRELKNEIIEILRLEPEHPWAKEVWNSRFKLEKMEKSDDAEHQSRLRRRLPAPR
jgi:tetratricopeptide (TPR) repeat protein